MNFKVPRPYSHIEKLKSAKETSEILSTYKLLAIIIRI